RLRWALGLGSAIRGSAGTKHLQDSENGWRFSWNVSRFLLRHAPFRRESCPRQPKPSSSESDALSVGIVGFTLDWQTDPTLPEGSATASVGWGLDGHMTEALVPAAPRAAVGARPPQSGLLHATGRGGRSAGGA